MAYSSDNTSLQNQLPQSVELSDDPKELRYNINDLYQRIVTAVNNKVGGLYVPEEKINSQQYFTATNTQQYRNIYRMVVDFGALPNNESKSIPHNITGWNNNYRLTCAYGGATNPSSSSFLPISNNGILLSGDANNVTVTTTSDLSAYTACTIVIEYAKSQ